VWAARQTPEALADALAGSAQDSARRFVALEALVLQARTPERRPAVEQALTRVAEGGPPLGRLCAQIGRAFLSGTTEEMHAFLDRLFGG
jgi:hypothetical protein